MTARTRIVVILRHPDLRRKLATMLTKAGYDVFQAEDRVDGLPLLYQVQPNLIFLEVVAQQNASWETFSRIRLLTKTPVILLADQPPRRTDQSLEKENAFVLLQPFANKAAIAQAKAVLKQFDESGWSSASQETPASRTPSDESSILPEQLSCLTKLLSSINRTGPVEQIVDLAMLNQLRMVSKADWIAFCHIAPDDATHSLPIRFQLLPETPPWSETQAEFMRARFAEAVESRQVCVSDKTATWQISATAWNLERAGLGSFAIVPLIGRDRVHGALAAVNRVEPSDGLVSEQIQFIHTVAEAIALAMDNVCLMQQRGSADILDESTGVYSSAYLEQIVAMEGQRRNRYGRPFARVTIDWLNFQLFDEGYGRRACMETLGAMANLVRKHLRAADIVARSGDRAIALVLPETNGAGGQRVADRMVEVIQAGFATSATAIRPVVSAVVETEWKEPYDKSGRNAEPDLAAR